MSYVGRRFSNKPNSDSATMISLNKGASPSGRRVPGDSVENRQQTNSFRPMPMNTGNMSDDYYNNGNNVDNVLNRKNEMNNVEISRNMYNGNNLNTNTGMETNINYDNTNPDRRDNVFGWGNQNGEVPLSSNAGALQSKAMNSGMNSYMKMPNNYGKSSEDSLENENVKVTYYEDGVEFHAMSTMENAGRGDFLYNHDAENTRNHGSEEHEMIDKDSLVTGNSHNRYHQDEEIYGDGNARDNGAYSEYTYYSDTDARKDLDADYNRTPPSSEVERERYTGDSAHSNTPYRENMSPPKSQYMDNANESRQNNLFTTDNSNHHVNSNVIASAKQGASDLFGEKQTSNLKDASSLFSSQNSHVSNKSADMLFGNKQASSPKDASELFGSNQVPIVDNKQPDTNDASDASYSNDNEDEDVDNSGDIQHSPTEHESPTQGKRFRFNLKTLNKENKVAPVNNAVVDSDSARTNKQNSQSPRIFKPPPNIMGKNPPNSVTDASNQQTSRESVFSIKPKDEPQRSFIPNNNTKQPQFQPQSHSAAKPPIIRPPPPIPAYQPGSSPNKTSQPEPQKAGYDPTRGLASNNGGNVPQLNTNMPPTSIQKPPKFTASVPIKNSNSMHSIGHQNQHFQVPPASRSTSQLSEGKVQFLRPNRPIMVFGYGGYIVKRNQNNQIEVNLIKNAFSNSSIIQQISSFKANVIKKPDEFIKHCIDNVETAEDSLLWSAIRVRKQHNQNIDPVLFNAEAKKQGTPENQLLAMISTKATTTVVSPQFRDTSIHPSSVDKLQDIIQHKGNEEALEFCVKNRMWSFALIISASMSREAHSKVVQAFIQNTMQPSPLTNILDAITGLTHSFTNSSWLDKLIVIVQNYTKDSKNTLNQMTEFLMNSFNVKIAHLCFLLASNQLQEKPSPFALIGSLWDKPTITAVQMSQLCAPRSETFLSFTIYYTLALADFGFMDDATDNIDKIHKHIQKSNLKPVLEMLNSLFSEIKSKGNDKAISHVVNYVFNTLVLGEKSSADEQESGDLLPNSISNENISILTGAPPSNDIFYQDTGGNDVFENNEYPVKKKPVENLVQEPLSNQSHNHFPPQAHNASQPVSSEPKGHHRPPNSFKQMNQFAQPPKFVSAETLSVKSRGTVEQVESSKSSKRRKPVAKEVVGLPSANSKSGNRSTSEERIVSNGVTNQSHNLNNEARHSHDKINRNHSEEDYDIPQSSRTNKYSKYSEGTASDAQSRETFNVFEDDNSFNSYQSFEYASDDRDAQEQNSSDKKASQDEPSSSQQQNFGTSAKASTQEQEPVKQQDQGDEEKKNSGWFGWMKWGKKPVKAHLEEETKSYFDEESQKWVFVDANNKEISVEAPAPAPPPISKKKGGMTGSESNQSIKHIRRKHNYLGTAK